MALRGALVSNDKWRLCILNGLGALATLTRSPRAGWNFSLNLSSLGSAQTEESNLSEILTHRKNEDLCYMCVCVHVSLN